MWTLFDCCCNPYYGKTQLSEEKRPSIITLRNEGQSIRNMSRTLNVTSSAVAKTMERYDETGSHEDPPTNTYFTGTYEDMISSVIEGVSET